MMMLRFIILMSDYVDVVVQVYEVGDTGEEILNFKLLFYNLGYLSTNR
jgi:hypothetical protein